MKVNGMIERSEMTVIKPLLFSIFSQFLILFSFLVLFLNLSWWSLSSISTSRRNSPHKRKRRRICGGTPSRRISLAIFHLIAKRKSQREVWRNKLKVSISFRYRSENIDIEEENRYDFKIFLEIFLETFSYLIF